MNNPEDSDTNATLPAGWKLEGQYEEGKEGTRHFQGMLSTPQVRFSAVKKIFPRAHIEPAKNKLALANYVRKQDTRVGEFESRESGFINPFDAQRDVADRFSRSGWTEYRERMLTLYKANEADCFLGYIDSLVRQMIEDGCDGIEYVASNPSWRSMWKLFGPQIISRREKQRAEELAKVETNSIVEANASSDEEAST